MSVSRNRKDKGSMNLPRLGIAIRVLHAGHKGRWGTPIQTNQHPANRRDSMLHPMGWLGN
jgi:hypothetical protein